MKQLMLAITFVALLVPTAKATIITYEGVAPDGGSFFLDGTMVLDDFLLTTNGSSFVDSEAPGVGTTMPDNGTDYIRPSRVGFFQTIELVSMDFFSLVSIDAADRNSDSAGGESFVISGVTESGAAIMEMFTTPLKASSSDPSLFTTFTLNDPVWTNVSSITIGQSVRFNFDNVVIGPATPVLVPAPVPEPSTLTLLVTGLAGLGFMMRRRRSNYVAPHDVS